jgi:hypothetical protein
MIVELSRKYAQETEEGTVPHMIFGALSCMPAMTWWHHQIHCTTAQALLGSLYFSQNGCEIFRP